MKPSMPSLGVLREISLAFLKLGCTAYGGPAIMGIMQAELQEKRQWVSKTQFVEGLALVSMLPGAAATQLGIFLGYIRGGWWGGLLAGLCFILPAFFIMLSFAMAYGVFAATPLVRSALYGLGPVVLAIFAVATYRLGMSTVDSIPRGIIAATAGVLAAFGLLGVVPILAIAAGAGLAMFYSRKVGVLVMGIVAIFIAATHFLAGSIFDLSSASAIVKTDKPDLFTIATFFLVVGTFSFGGGLTLIAFIQDQVVTHYQWLTQQEFIDGLALGQLTPGPILMVSAYVGYKLQGFVGAALAAAAMFAPAFVLMLVVLPMLEKVRQLAWTKAAMKGIGPAVIGVLGVSLLQMAPYAVPDVFAMLVFAGALTALLVWRLGVMKLMVVGACLGILRHRFP